MSSETDSKSKSPLHAAQKIVTELEGMPPEQQSLALKFAIETLGLKSPSSFSPATPHPGPTPQPTPASPIQASVHSTDIRSFTAMKAPKSDQQFTAVVAYFYQFEAKPEERKESIDAETMKEAARLAGRAQVERWNMTLTNAKNAGYLDSAGDGKYRLSSVGENLVAITLPGNGTSGGARRNNSARKPAKRPTKKTKKKG